MRSRFLSVHFTRRAWILGVCVFACGVLLVLSFALIQPQQVIVASSPPGEWLTYHADTARTGNSSARIGAQVTERWTHVVSGLIASEPVLANGRVYIGSWSGYFYALDAATGQEIWRTFLGTFALQSYLPACGSGIMGVNSSATLDPSTNTLYLEAEDSTVTMTLSSDPHNNPLPYLYAIDAASGAILWRKQLTGDNAAYAWPSPLVVNGKAYVGISSIAGACPLTQGQLVAVDLTTHAIQRIKTAPDAVTVYPTSTLSLLPDGSDYDQQLELTMYHVSATATDMRLILRRLNAGQAYRPQLDTGTCANPTFVQYLGDSRQADSTGVLTYTGTVVVDTTTLTDGHHLLVVPGMPCSVIEAGLGGGVWGAPVFDAPSNSIYIATGSATPPCIPQSTCNDRPSIYGLRSPAVLALDANSLAIKGMWQMPLSQQGKDTDFGATPSLCVSKQGRRVLAVGNKNGIFYAFNAGTPGAWVNGPLWQRSLAVGGDDPEQYGILSAAACVNGVFYVGTAQPLNGSACAGSTGQIMALDADTGNPAWAHPHCTGVTIGPITAANGYLLYGTDCRDGLLGCSRRVEMLDIATGAALYTGTGAQLPGLGDVVTGIAVRDSTMVFGDGSPYGPDPFFPVTSTVRSLRALPPVLYLPMTSK